MELKESKVLQDQLDQERSKLGGLQNDLAGVDGRIQEIGSAISAERERTRQDAIGDAARQLIAGEPLRSFKTTQFESELEDLYGKRRILMEAIRLQRVTVEQASSRFSAVAGQELRPEYRQKIAAIAKAVIVLSQAVMDESAFRDQLTKEGIQFGNAFGNGMTFSKIGHLTDRYSRASIYLRELVKYGWFSADEIEAMKKA